MLPNEGDPQLSKGSRRGFKVKKKPSDEVIESVNSLLQCSVKNCWNKGTHTRLISSFKLPLGMWL